MGSNWGKTLRQASQEEQSKGQVSAMLVLLATMS